MDSTASPVCRDARMNGGTSAAIPIDISGAQVLNTSRRGDGRQQIIKVTHDQTFIILKCYGLKRTRLRALIRQFGSRFVVRKSSITAKARRDTELEVLALWTREGFDVPAVYPQAEPPRDFPCCVVMEWIPGPTVTEMLRDDHTPLAFKKEVIARYAGVWARRHARALELNEPRLLQENPTLSHVFLSGDRLVHFDFEIVFTWEKDLERLVRREIAGVLQSMSKASGDNFGPLLDTLLEAYPDLSHFRQTARELGRYGTVPEVGWSAILHRLTRGKKRYRKRLNLIRALDNALKARTNSRTKGSGSF